jgi:peptide/nickel transport system substrate-binding protein
VQKIDATTVAFKFDDPYPLFLTVLGGTTAMGSGLNSSRGFYQGAYLPAHYMKQFLPKYTSQDELSRQARDLKLEDWRGLFRLKSQHSFNPDLPGLGPWRTTVPINTPTWVMERNTYYYAVDTDGNQLPYIDKIQFALAEDLEVINLRAIAGEYDHQERHTAVAKIPVFLENAARGNYTLHLDPALNGQDAAIQTNQTYDADPEIGRLLRNRDFRHALALGIDRDQLNETFWLGLGTPGNATPSEQSPYSPGRDFRTRWAVYDPKQANDLLDGLGLDKKDSSGIRLRSDGKPLVVEVFAPAGAVVPMDKIAEMVGQHWKKIGIRLTISSMERNLAFDRMRNNEHQLFMWGNDGSEVLYAFPRHAMPVDPVEPILGPLYAKWFASNGQQGSRPDEQMVKAMALLTRAAGEDEPTSIRTAQEIWKILAEETYSIGTVGVSPATLGVRVVKNTLGNVPDRQVNAQHVRSPCQSHPEQFYFRA